MKRVLISVAKAVALIGGYVAALSAARTSVAGFRYYIDAGAFSNLYNWLNFEPMISAVTFVICAVLLFFCVWKSKGKRSPLWRKVDLYLFAALTWGAVWLCVYYAAHNFHYGERLFFVSVIIYALVVALTTEVAARLRDKQWNLIWPKFFKQYSIRRPVGLVIALVAAGNFIYVCIYYPTIFLFRLLYGQGPTIEKLFSTFLQMNATAFLFSMFTLAALTFVCSFLLSMADEYEKANAEKIRAERFKAELITNVSHDIRTPLTSIINYTDLLKALPIEHDDFSEYIDVLDKKAARLKILVKDLMDASQAATGNIAVNLLQVDLCEMVGQIAGEFDDQFAERDLTLVLRQPDEPVWILTDGNHLRRALENLFGNAAKYALSGTRVFAEIGERGGKTIFSLKNTSQNPIDLPADMLMEQFIRGDRARQTEGSGLGLYIAKSLVELTGGHFYINATGDLFEAEIIFC